MQRQSEPIKEETLVIRSIRHGESSRIVTLFGIEHGKFAVISKGARRSRSGAALSGVEPPGRIEAVVYFKPSRSVQTLGQVTILDSYRRIKRDLSLTVCASAVLQHIAKALSDAEPNEEVYHSATEALQALELSEGDPRIKLWLFQTKLIKAIGFGMDPFPCPICGRSTAEIDRYNRLLLDEGKICCHTCNPGNRSCITISGESVSILRRISLKSDSGINNLKVSRNSRLELTHTLEKFLKYHHPGMGDLTALGMLDKLEDQALSAGVHNRGS